MNSFIPGQVCRYVGPVTSLILEEHSLSDSEQAFEQDPMLEVSSRDFLASLHRMLAIGNEYFVHQFDSLEERRRIVKTLLSPGFDTEGSGGVLSFFKIQNVNADLAHDPALNPMEIPDPDADFDSTYYLNRAADGQRKNISDSVIRVLSTQLLKEENP